MEPFVYEFCTCNECFPFQKCHQPLPDSHKLEDPDALRQIVLICFVSQIKGLDSRLQMPVFENISGAFEKHIYKPKSWPPAASPVFCMQNGISTLRRFPHLVWSASARIHNSSVGLDGI